MSSFVKSSAVENHCRRHDDASLRVFEMSSSGMSPFYPLFVLSAPTLLIATAALSLHQFKMFYIAFTNMANERSGNPLWMMVQPVMKDLARVMEGVLGNAHSFKPGLTHVMLTALMLAIIVSLERVRSAVLASKRAPARLD